MFGDVDSEIVDLNEKPRKSLIPDPEGDELRKIAKMKGFTIVSYLVLESNWILKQCSVLQQNDERRRFRIIRRGEIVFW